jgi:hypothetical protein
LIAAAALAIYLLAAKIASRWAALAISCIDVPIILTGTFYLSGYTELPGVVLTLIAIAAMVHGRAMLAGSCIGLLIFLKLIYVPIALVGIGCFTLARGRLLDAFPVGLGAILSAAAVIALLIARGELIPFLESIRQNIAYSQGSLIGFKKGVAALAKHLSRVGLREVTSEVSLIVLSIMAILIFLAERGKENLTMFMVTGAGIATLFFSLLVLSITGLWGHHGEVLYISAIMTTVGLTPMLDMALKRTRFPTLGLVVIVGYLLAGGPSPLMYFLSLKDSYASYVGLSEISPETRALLSIGDRGVYARFGTNDDWGHATGIPGWKLMCPRFHQYPFEPPDILNSVFECASNAPTLIISLGFRSDSTPPWDAFVARVEQLLVDRFSCEARAGLRICSRTSPASF